MPIALRQSTASQEIPLGYFLDSTDGNSEETALTIANTDIKLWKAGATTLANKNSGGATHISNGIYYAVLDATDTDTVGSLVVFCHVSGALAVRVQCQVYEEAVYDALFAAAAPGYQVPIWAAANSTVSLSATTVAAVTTVNGLAANVVNASALAADAVAEIQSGLATSASIGSGGASLTAIPWNAAWDAEVQSEVEDGLRVNNLDHLMAVTVTGADVADNSALAKLVSKSATADWDTYVNTTDSLEAARDNMGTAGAGLNAMPWNAAWDTEVQSEVQDAIEVNHLDHLLAVDYDPASKPGVATALLNELIESDAGVSRYTANALEQAPSGTGASASAIADAVWDEAISGHLTAGSTGEALNAAGAAGDPWTTTLPGSYTGSQAGKMLSDILTDTGTTLQAELDGIQADTENIQTRIPAALVGGRMDSDVGMYQTGMVPLFATVQGRTLDVTATGAAGVDWANVEGQATIVNLEATSIETASALVVPIATIDAAVDSLTADVAALQDLSAAQAADAVWDELIAGHLTASTTGAALNAAGSAGDPWTTTLPGAYTGAQAGKILADILVDTGTTLDALLQDVPTTAEFNARTLPSTSYFDPATDTVANVTTVANLTNGATLAANSVSASALATDAVAEIVNAILAAAVDGTITVAQLLRIIPALVSKSSTVGSTVKLRNPDDTLDRVTLVVDGSNNRTSSTLNLS